MSYEYKTVKVLSAKRAGRRGRRAQQKLLNKMAAQGWELANADRIDSWYFGSKDTLTFRRQTGEAITHPAPQQPTHDSSRLGGGEWLLSQPIETSSPPQPIDPVEVRLGDRVEIEATNKSWMMRGRVVETQEKDSDKPFGVYIGDSDYHWPSMRDAVTRLVSRPASVEQLKLYGETEAYELIKREGQP